ncbi:ligase-associated DNA damage response DEXH box helicase [Albimonas sp. CAU 1670]|uniref:ligase-associated DNA damage response DEXH box helicase n=1 Tax=Albimonas sp. CAU 1670 TaxID=3032599 RepID=UPI0023D9FDD9|nr:ligase-associated DNA damage response DEXH box helicase [Albimonas sp. CAU 1670]MDF2233357.1 ligase-associated DNA damage response DEXH box helicase [Albimonas sp. CAU 1670]
MDAAPSPDPSLLPPRFADWFARQGWAPHPHQLALLENARLGGADLLVAPTGGGKTLAGFLPSLVALEGQPRPGLHTLYVSPLKALAADIRRNLQRPIEEMGLTVRVEDRTGDTKQSARRRQRADPPQILLTTPESLALLLSYEDAPRIFAGLSRVIVDEAHALAESKRGDQLMLGLARLRSLSPGLTVAGLSATVEDPAKLGRWLSPAGCRVLAADPGPEPDIAMLASQTPPPWYGQGGRYAAAEVMDLIRRHRTTLIFHNTRAQAELFFQALWSVNDDVLPIAIHHGSLDRETRVRVEAAMAEGALRAVVCTGTLDLGIDWGDVDLVVQVGAPKNVKRLVQRIGRANHRYNAPSRALIVPANRFEVLECQAALEAVREHDLDGEAERRPSLDVLCQHILATACAGPFQPDALFAEVRLAGPYADLTRADFDACLEFCATGGYALAAYDRWKRLVEGPDGAFRLRDPRLTRPIRMNLGTIVGTETLGVRLKGKRGGGPKLGEVEEDFAANLSPGDTFLIGGEVVRFESIRELTLEVSRAPGRKPKIAVFGGSKFSTSTLLSNRVMDLLQSPERWSTLPPAVESWLRLQADRSEIPPREGLLVETFGRRDRFGEGRHHLCAYGFAGRNAHQTLGLLLTRRMEAAGLAPLGFVSSDYALLVWGLEEVTDPAPLFEPQGLRDGLETWLGDNAVMKRTFRNAAIIAGLIERNQPGGRKSGRQATFSSDILYDTLRRYDPDHLMMRITREEAMRGLVDFDRIEEMLTRAAGRIRHVRAEGVTPLAAPLLLEVGKVPIKGEGSERLVEGEAAALMAEAGLDPL